MGSAEDKTVMTWIDGIVDIFREIDAPGKKKVRSYSIFKKNEFPDALTVFPSALVFPDQMTLISSEGGPCIEIWDGRAELHAVSNLDRSQLPDLLRYFPRIRNGFALHQTLGGRVAYCVLRPGDSGAAIEGPVKLQYGSEPEHLGLIAYWRVKINVTGTYSFGN